MKGYIRQPLFSEFHPEYLGIHIDCLSKKLSTFRQGKVISRSGSQKSRRGTPCMGIGWQSMTFLSAAADSSAISGDVWHRVTKPLLLHHWFLNTET